MIEFIISVLIEQMIFLPVKLFVHGHNNSQHCWANNVGSCCVRVSSGVQTDAALPKMLAHAVHRGMDTTHKTL